MDHRERDVDELARHGGGANRNEPLQGSIRDELRRLKQVALAEECAKLDPRAEQAEAEKWLNGEGMPLER